MIRTCHAERSEASAFFFAFTSRFFASLGMTGRGTFISIGGPKAHVTLLRMTGRQVNFHEPSPHRFVQGEAKCLLFLIGSKQGQISLLPPHLCVSAVRKAFVPSISPNLG